MSVVRTIVASAVASLAIVATARPAAAFQPITGTKNVGPSYSKDISSGDFGAGFEIFARGYASQYEQLCESTQPSQQCAGLAGFAKTICEMVYGYTNDMVCAQNYGTGVGYGAEGKAAADLTLFGEDFDLFDIGASAKVEPDSSLAEWHVKVAGVSLGGYSQPAGFTKSWTAGERTLVSATSTFMLGPIPIKVEAAAVGSMGIDAGLELGSSKASGTVTPWVAVDGEFSAGLGTKGLSAGVQGDLLLVKLSTPATASLTWQGGKAFGYDASLDLQIDSLDGAISLYGEAGPYKKTWEIFSWDGLTYTKDLGRSTGTFSL